MQHILSLSGGADSTALLLWMIDNHYPIDRVIFIDTTKDFPELHHHLKSLQSYIRPLQIEVFSFDFDKDFTRYGWPRMGSRWCTAKKISIFETAVYGNRTNRFAPGRKQDIIEYHGIHKDEIFRRGKFQNSYRNICYPLAKAGFSAEDTVSYCYDHEFFFGGMYEILSRLSCFCCTLSNSAHWGYIHDFRPVLWREVLAMHERSPYPFTPYHPTPQSFAKSWRRRNARD